MTRTHTPVILIASNYADTRVAVSWMLRQSYPNAIVSKAETVADALSAAAAESPACVIGDSSLPEFETKISEFTQTLQQSQIPLIVLHDGPHWRLTENSDCSGIAAWLDRSSINVATVDLAVSKAIDLSTTSSSVDMLEKELTLAQSQVESANNTIAELQKTAAEQCNREAALASSSTADSANDARDTSVAREHRQLMTASFESSTADERELAGRVQKDLMPPGSPLLEGFDIAGLSIPAETTGGDYYDYLPMADDLLCVSIGECSGRGLAPAMLMASLRAYLRVLASSSTDISDVLSQVNTLITEDIGDEEFIVTLMLFQIDPRVRQLRYASAGHQAFFFDSDGNVDVLPSTGMPLGLRDETVIPEGSSQKIRPGEILLLASDGVQKMTSGSGEQFGTDRMLNLVKENRTLPSRIIANYLRKACTEFASPQFRSDDVTIVIIKGDDSVI